MTAFEFIKLGNKFRREGKYKEAHNVYNKAISVFPDNTILYIEKAKTLLKQRRYGEAHKAYDKAIELLPIDATSHAGKGDIFFEQGKYEEAIKAYNKAIEIFSGETSFHIKKGRVLRELGEYKKAHEAYEKAMAINQHLALLANKQKGDSYTENEKKQEGNTAIERLFGISFNQIVPHMEKGKTFLEQGKFQEAHAIFDKAINAFPNIPELYNGKGNTYAKQGKFQEAHDAFDKAIEIDPKYATPYNGKGNTYARQGKFQEAHDAFDKAIEIDPSIGNPHRGKTQLYLLQADYPNAIIHLNRWTVLMGYSWLDAKSTIMPLVPLFTKELVKSYGLPPWKRTSNYRRALQIAVSFEALKTFQKIDFPFSATEEGLFRFYLGDQPASYFLFRQGLTSQEKPSLQICYYAIRSSKICISPLTKNLLDKVKRLAFEQLQLVNKVNRISFLRKSPQLSDEEIKNFYYAGHILRLIDHDEDSLKCFEKIAKHFPPARIATLMLRFILGKRKQAEKELSAFVADENAMQYIGRGVKKEFINPDTPLRDYLQRYAYHDELREVTHFLSLRSRRLPQRVFDGAKLDFFFEIFTFDTPGLNKLYNYFRTSYLKSFYKEYYEKDLNPRTREAYTQDYIDEINDAVDKIPPSRPKEILDQVSNLPELEDRPRSIAGYFDAGELVPEKALLLNNYFFVNGNAVPYNKWKLDFYIIEKASQAGWQPSKPLEGGSKGALKKLFENPIGRVGETLAMLGSATMGASIIGSVLIGISTKFASSFLAELLLQYLKSNKTNFQSYAEFEESFEVYIAEQRQNLGAEAFRKRFPLEVLKE
jgi:tetratricopeptide (TPR) repeat protein